jgi:hypothetical protein
MRALLSLFKYIFVLVLVLAGGLYAFYAYSLYGLSPEDNSDIAARSAAAVVANNSARAGLADEELDYRSAQRLGSLEVWRAFLRAHGDGAHAESAKQEVERLRLAGRGPEGAPKDIAPDPKAASATMDPPSPAGAEVAGPAPGEACRRDENRLARLRLNPSSDEAQRFGAELDCEALRPQVLALVASLAPAAAAAPAPEAANGEAKVASGSPDPQPPTVAAVTPATPATEIANDAPAEAKAVSQPQDPAPPSPETVVSTLAPDDVCKHDLDRLARLRASPSSDEAQRLAADLGCERLRPQLLRLIDSLNFAAPPPKRSPPDATLTEVCASERNALDHLRQEPSEDAARLFWRALRCEGLRPQVRLLMESLNLTPERTPTPGADPDACRRETAELNRIRAAPDLGDARRFAAAATCDALKPQAARLLQSLSE